MTLTMIKDFLIKYLMASVAFFASYFAPTFHLLLAIGFMVAVDFITGVLAAKKNKEEITSKKMRATGIKLLGYMLTILVAHVFQKHFLPEIEVMKIVAGLLAFFELKSLDENMKTITGKSIFKQFLK